MVSLIVMEQGSEWPGHVGDSDDVVATGSSSETLLAKIQLVFLALRRRNQQVRVAVLACNAATDAESAARRAAVARELLGLVATVGCGRLVLSAAERSSTQLRRELLSLVGVLSDGLRGSSATLWLRFGSESRKA
jgi:glutamate racemase